MEAYLDKYMEIIWKYNERVREIFQEEYPDWDSSVFGERRLFLANNVFFSIIENLREIDIYSIFSINRYFLIKKIFDIHRQN